jgi:hypothetical protein
MLSAMPKVSDREALIKAHRAAQEFHEAMDEALTYERDIEDAEADLRDARDEADRESASQSKAEWEKLYSRALGRVAVALQKMPIKWAAILNEQVPAVKPEGTDA